MDEVKGCSLKYEDLGRRYMENARARTRNNPWDTYLYGLALTMTRNSANHPEVLADLKERVPTPEAAREACKGNSRPYIPTADLTYDPGQIQQSICDNARQRPVETPDAKGKLRITRGGQSWDHLKWQLQQCTQKNPVLDQIREGVRDHYSFRQQKGPDMLMLEAGCETPVMDVWMMRYALGVPIKGYTEAERAATEIVESQELEGGGPKKSRSKWKKLGLEAKPAGWEKLKGEVVSADDVTTRIRLMQKRPDEYQRAKNQIVQEAKACGVPAGIYHVSRWFELAEVTRDNRKAAEDYLDKLIGAMGP